MGSVSMVSATRILCVHLVGGSRFFIFDGMVARLCAVICLAEMPEKHEHFARAAYVPQTLNRKPLNDKPLTLNPKA